MGAGIGGGGNRRRVIADINITPFVDVVLVLLIIFMITAPEIYRKGLKLQLPKAGSGEALQRVSMSFALDKSGTLVVDGKPVEISEIDGILKEALAKDPNAEVQVAADSAVPHGSVVELLDKLKGAGITQISIAVDQASSR